VHGGSKLFDLLFKFLVGAMWDVNDTVFLVFEILVIVVVALVDVKHVVGGFFKQVVQRRFTHHY